mgnify:CR=1 FL=1
MESIARLRRIIFQILLAFLEPIKSKIVIAKNKTSFEAARNVSFEVRTPINEYVYFVSLVEQLVGMLLAASLDIAPCSKFLVNVW